MATTTGHEGGCSFGVTVLHTANNVPRPALRRRRPFGTAILSRLARSRSAGRQAEAAGTAPWCGNFTWRHEKHVIQSR